MTSTDSDIKHREEWVVGSECEIYSESESKWYDGIIMKITNDKEGEWLTVAYRTGIDVKTPTLKQIQRFAKEIKAKQQEKEKEKEKEEKEEKGELDGLCVGVHDYIKKEDNLLRISVIAPSLEANLKRLPAIICCVVDTSGSMSSDAVIKDINGKTESHGLTILDLVKHSIKTIIHCLKDYDYLSIVSYSSKAKVITDLIKMDKNGKERTLSALNNLRASGQTNLWDGLYNGLEILRNNKNIKCSMNNSAVLLFTDGLPNIIPPKGHQAMLDKYIDRNQELVGIINTYGFGYSLDTKLLNELAIKGNGNYSFIPDSSMVGTIFVNSITNFECNVAKNCLVKIETDNNKYNVSVLGDYEYLKTSWGIQVNLGNIMYEQNKDIILRFKAIDNNTMDEGKEGDDDKMYNVDINSLNYISLRDNKLINTAIDCIEYDDNNNNKKVTEMSYYRLLSCDILRKCMNYMNMNNMNDAQKELKELILLIGSNKNIEKEKYIIDLLQDLRGQAFEALSKKEYYDKWGKNYLPSLIFAHLHQYNNNFKDPGVQNYGGELFNDLRDKANDIFIKLPPPKPSKPKYNTYSYSYNNTNNNTNNNKSYSPPAPVDMSQYYDASGGCFHGQCNVLMDDNTLKCVQHLSVNDMVKGGGIIKCVVKHKCNGNKIKLSLINNSLLITGYHPIRINDEWVFPIDIDNGNHNVYECDYIYNFVLSENHIMIINGIECCTLGHNITTNQVIKHEYFGTNKVIEDLQKFNGWKNGMIVLNQNQFKRNLDDHLVYKIIE